MSASPTDQGKVRFVDRLAEASEPSTMNRRLLRQLRRQHDQDPATPAPPRKPLTPTEQRERLAVLAMRTFGWSGDRDTALEVAQQILDVDAIAAEAGADGIDDVFTEALDSAIERLATGHMAPMFTGPGSPTATAQRPAQPSRRPTPEVIVRAAGRRREPSKSRAVMSTAEVMAEARRPADGTAAKHVTDKLLEQGGVDQAPRPRPKRWYENIADDDPKAVTKRFDYRLTFGRDPKDAA